MTRPQVDEYLSIYRECVGRVGTLELDLPVMRAEIEKRKQRMIAEAALETPQREEGMPHGTGIGNPVERIVLKYADGFLPEDVIEAEKELTTAEQELVYKKWVVNHVEAWLKGLSEREAWIIIHKAIDVDRDKKQKYSWREIAMMYRYQYGEEYSEKTLRRIKKEAMERIYYIAGCKG